MQCGGWLSGKSICRSDRENARIRPQSYISISKNKKVERRIMKIIIVGGTGLLGHEAAKVALERGHEVTSLAIPDVPMDG